MSKLALEEYSTADTFFMGGDRRAVLDEILHLCQFSNNVVAVLGERGVGKTAFVHRAMTELHDTAKCCLVQASVMSDVDDIIHHIADQLGVFLSEGASIEQMLGVLGQYKPSGLQQRVVIVVDDSHQLNDVVLAAFIYLLQNQSSYYLHLLLVGDDSLLLRLDQMEKGELLVYDISLRPLTVDELEQYLAFKLAAVGYQGVELFDYDTVQAIWRDTQGIPASVNNIARNLLLDQSSLEDNEKILGLPIWHMTAVVMLLAALIMVVFYRGDRGDEVVDSQPTNTIDSVPPSIKPDIIPEPDVKTMLPEVSNADVLVAEPELKVQENDSTSENLAKSNRVENEVVLVNQPDTPQLPVEDKEAKQSKIPKDKSSDHSVVITQPLELTPTPKKSFFTQDEEAVLFWDSKSYTLQLLAARQLRGVQQFVATQSNHHLLRIVSFERDGVPWFAVLVGVYPTLDEARNGIRSLPASQIKSKPWPRKIETIQQEIRGFRRK
ncbi:hypothetical protein AB835_04555 [Candidatus Endobugula sertula]|uniref:SPOR domain-containing protein n=1 Tax=Candidatus Endobugula sertula TaxID=62101 RepID=A0A1D2QRT4_9GAMM|nr:hypothetical protein AB835_04555 [Candidatus Endobugula sertula]